MPEHDISSADIIAGVERAVARLLTTPELDDAVLDAIRRGVRDGVWHLGTAPDSPPAGRVN